MSVRGKSCVVLCCVVLLGWLVGGAYGVVSVSVTCVWNVLVVLVSRCLVCLSACLLVCFLFFLSTQSYFHIYFSFSVLYFFLSSFHTHICLFDINALSFSLLYHSPLAPYVFRSPYLIRSHFSYLFFSQHTVSFHISLTVLPSHTY